MNINTLAKVGRAIIQAKYKNKRIPLVASIIPTNRCNLKCKYCGRWETPTPELSVETWESIIDELADLGCVRLSVTGGEPFLFEGLDAIINKAKSRELQISLNTNGALMIRKLPIVEKVDSVVISLDGPRKINDGIRGCRTYDAAINAAKMARDLGKKLTLYTVLSKQNLNSLDHVASLAGGLGGNVIFQPGTYMDFDQRKENPEAPDIIKYREAVDRLISLKKKGYPIGNSITGLKYLRQWPGRAPINCYGARLFVRIEPDGNLRNCGRDAHGPENLVTDGVKVAIDRMVRPTCESCWSASRVEFNLIADGNLGAIIEYLRN